MDCLELRRSLFLTSALRENQNNLKKTMTRTKQRANGKSSGSISTFWEEDKIVMKMLSSEGVPPSKKMCFRIRERIPEVIEENRLAYNLAKEELRQTALHDRRCYKHLQGASIGTGECTVCSLLISAVKAFDIVEVTRSLSTLDADAMCRCQGRPFSLHIVVSTNVQTV